jgi:hypothetical protein
MPTPRERDVRGAILDILDSTGAFDAVYAGGLPEDRGERSGDRRAAAIEPGETRLAGLGDDVSGALAATATVTLVVLARDDDPAARDDAAELLLHTAAAALNGRPLAGLALPGSTCVRSWAWRKPVAPERRIEAVLEFRYLVEGWNAFDLSE